MSTKHVEEIGLSLDTNFKKNELFVQEVSKKKESYSNNISLSENFRLI